MKYQTATILSTFFGLVLAFPVPGDLSKDAFPPARTLRGREVPQEHSHEQFITSVRASLNENNPAGILDPVFGLLGNAAAAGGQGKITDTNCLQQATADQAFTNAKAAGNVQGQVDALIYRALERNTGKVGLASVACTSIQAVNPGIAAIAQHQDPASTGAAAINKAIVLELAKQINAVGGDPQDALKSGTFAPGNLSDDTGKGNTCDTQNDPIGCIFSQNLLVDDATAAEIDAAVGGAASDVSTTTAAAATTAATAVAAATTEASEIQACAAPTTVTVTADAEATAAAASTSAVAEAENTSAAAASGTNVQTFTGALGGAAPPVIFTAGAARPFAVDGTTDINKAAALQRSCDVQHNLCADAANSGTLAGGEQQCETQHTACLAAADGTAATAATTASAAAAAATTAAAATSGTNVQTFTGSLGGAAPPVIFTAGAARPFAVDGTTDINKAAALQRSCDVQHNACANAANSGSLAGGEQQCETQHAACLAAA